MWAAVAGFALGMTVINRPLAALAIGLPFIAWSGVRLLRALIVHEPDAPAEVVYTPAIRLPNQPEPSIPAPFIPSSIKNETAVNVEQTLAFQPRRLLVALLPLTILGLIAATISVIIPAYQYAAVGNPSLNLYTLVWEYDQVGFGPGYGRNIHTLEKGYRQTRWDLSLTAADLFGWQTGQITPELQDHLRTEADYWPPVGLSWIFLPVGIVMGLMGLRRRWLLMAGWFAVTVFIVLQTPNLPQETLRNPTFATGWLIATMLWAVVPLLWLGLGKQHPRVNWTWLFVSVILCIVLAHVAYWVGSQRYSTRYYFEALTGVAILSAVPLAWLARQSRMRWLVYGGLLIALLYSLYAYSTPRIMALYRFNWVSTEVLNRVESMREPGKQVLVIVTGSDVRWRALGSLMAVTSPYLNSDIVGALDFKGPDTRQQILNRFPDRQIIEMTAQGNWACFGTKLEGECYGETPTSGG
jgi:hypothetical protein